MRDGALALAAGHFSVSASALSICHLAVWDWNTPHGSFSTDKVIGLGTLRLLYHNKWMAI